jgi:hypothetical protein
MNQWAIGDMGARHKPRWLEKSADFDFLNTLETGSDHIHRRLFDPTVLFFLVGLLVARKVRPGGRRPGLGSGTDDFLNQTQSFGGLFLLAAFGSRLNGQSAVRASVEDCHPNRFCCVRHCRILPFVLEGVYGAILANRYFTSQGCGIPVRPLAASKQPLSTKQHLIR